MTELNNYQEIREYVIELENRIYDIKNIICGRGKKPKNHREIKKELLEVKQKRDEYVRLIDSLTTFEKESLLDFFKEYLPILEDEEVVFDHLKREDNIEEDTIITKIFKKMNCMLDLREEAYIVSDASGIETIRELFKTKDIYGAYKTANVKGFYLYDDEEVHLADGVALKKEFTSYHSIEYAFERLIDLGIQNKDMTPQERLDKVLCEIKENKEDTMNRKISLRKMKNFIIQNTENLTK